jgi:predicted HicB family RNase H-like nuclease
MTQKNFRDDPVLQFLSVGAGQSVQVDATSRKTHETKSRRLQLLLKPSLLEKIQLRAAAAGESVNETIHKLLKVALTGG